MKDLWRKKRSEEDSNRERDIIRIRNDRDNRNKIKIK